jgi:hypothetical protein
MNEPDQSIKVEFTLAQVNSLIDSIHNSSDRRGEFSMYELQNLKLLIEARKGQA